MYSLITQLDLRTHPSHQLSSRRSELHWNNSCHLLYATPPDDPFHFSFYCSGVERYTLLSTNPYHFLWCWLYLPLRWPTDVLLQILTGLFGFRNVLCSSSAFSYHLNIIVMRPYRHTTSNSDRLGTSGRVSAPSTCNATDSPLGGLCTQIRQLTCALADHRSLEAKMPFSRLSLRPCSSRPVTVVLRQIFARKTWVKRDHVVKLMGRPLTRPRLATRAR
jgi:hypothetical protein